MFNQLFAKKITVEFIDVQSGAVFAQSEMDAGQLPESFALNTTIQLGEEEWQVKEAIPAHATEFKKTGKLTLKLSRIQYVNPQDLLFSLPTISNELPTLVSEAPFKGDLLTIREDDWRQIEFLPSGKKDLVQQEIAHIKSVFEHHSQTLEENFIAFTKLHVRNHVGSPSLKIPFDQLKELFGLVEVGSISFTDSTEFVQAGFSIALGTINLYGVLEDAVVTELCLTAIDEVTVEKILPLLYHQGLILVDWCSCEVIE